jgi:hypothetical protein
LPDLGKKKIQVVKLTSVKVSASFSIGKQFETLLKQFGKGIEVWEDSAPM